MFYSLHNSCLIMFSGCMQEAMNFVVRGFTPEFMRCTLQ